MATVEFNVNDFVKVKLTEHGLRMLQKQHVDLFSCHPTIMRAPIWQPPAIDAEGYSKFQLHVLMDLFGRQMQMGSSQLPFETNILLEVPD